MWLALLIACSYLFGAIPFGFLIAKAKGVDIRKVGSGNIGATNVYRILGKGPGLVVFALDILKGLLPALAARLLFKDESLGFDNQMLAFAAGIAAVIGHCLSPFLGFKGGKGIATGLGVIFGVSPLVALTAFIVFLIFMLITRYVSLSSILGSSTIIPMGFVMKDPLPLIGAYVLLFAFILYRHRPNIARLRQGTEPKFSFKGTAAAAPPENKASLLLIVMLLPLVTLACGVATT